MWITYRALKVAEKGTKFATNLEKVICCGFHGNFYLNSAACLQSSIVDQQKDAIKCKVQCAV